MEQGSENRAVRRVMVGADRSETADQAVRWAASFAEPYGAELFVVQVIVPRHPASTEAGAREGARSEAARDELAVFSQQLAGERGHAVVVVDPDPAMAIVRVAEQEAADVLMVGNLGMAAARSSCWATCPIGSVTTPAAP